MWIWLAVLAAGLGGMVLVGDAARSPAAMAACWLAAFAGLWKLNTTGIVRKDGPRLFWALLGLGLAARLALFWTCPPSNDVYRYVWEGWLQLHGGNPYLHAPESAALIPFRGGAMADIWPWINHKDFSAVYPPVSQLLFRLAAWISPTLLSAKLLVLAFDCLAVACLARLARKRDLPPAAIALYACNPLVLQYFSGEGHLDAIQLGLVAAAMLCFDSRRAGAGFLLLGLGGMAKYLAFALVPFFLDRTTWKKAWLSLVPLLLCLPYLEPGAQLLGPLARFGGTMHYNDVIQALLRELAGQAASRLALPLLGMTLLAIWLAGRDRLRDAGGAALAMLLFLPTLHPWYLGLAAAFLPFTASRSVLLLLAAQCWTFAVAHMEWRTGVFQEILWLKWAAAAPFWWLWVREFWRAAPLRPAPSPLPTRVISIILPVLDEAARLPAWFEALRLAVLRLRAREDVAVEVILADGGSRDGVAAVAASRGARVVAAPLGRGRQIRAACHQARGELLLIVHADALVQPEALADLCRVARERPEAAGGALGMRFEDDRDGLWLIERLNALRARLFGITFGDQGQWLRRETLEAMGGFPDLWLMEDVECALRMRELGPVHVPPRREAGLRVSTRGWRERGLARGTGSVLSLFFRYLVERRLGLVRDQAASYHARYYGRPSPRPEPNDHQTAA